MVKSVKRCLRKSIGRTSLHFDELNTLMTEVESVVDQGPSLTCTMTPKVSAIHCVPLICCMVKDCQ